MKLLLLLSALLSALIGVSGTARGVEPTRAIAVGTVAEQGAAERRVAVAQRPIASLPGLVAPLMRSFQSPFRLVAHEPLYASRRRE